MYSSGLFHPLHPGAHRHRRLILFPGNSVGGGVMGRGKREGGVGAGGKGEGGVGAGGSELPFPPHPILPL